MAQTVLITGGSRGIGYATAKLFAVKGWQVALCSRNAYEAKEAAAAISKATANAEVFGMGCDVGDNASVAAMFDAITSRYGGLTALVNNAGVIALGSLESLSESDFDRMMNINLGGVVRCCKHAFALMKPDGGSIVNISSLAGIQGTTKFPNFWGYTASKFAVTGLSEALAVEGKRLGIRVNCVAPGATETEMLRKALPGVKANAQPEDIAAIIYYLCDKTQSGILTGVTIPVLN